MPEIDENSNDEESYESGLKELEEENNQNTDELNNAN